MDGSNDGSNGGRSDGSIDASIDDSSGSSVVPLGRGCHPLETVSPVVPVGVALVSGLRGLLFEVLRRGAPSLRDFWQPVIACSWTDGLCP